MTTLQLRAGAWSATLLPAVGGSIGSLRLGSDDILRPTPDVPSSALDTACFPLVPYANRIAHGRFRFAGKDVDLARNFGDHPHPLHGVGWQRPWEVVDATERAATLRLVHAADADWPWPFTAEQRVRLDDAGLAIDLTVIAGDEPMPAGLGFHPYFPAAGAPRLQTAIAGAWLSDETMLPTERVAADRFGHWVEGDSVVRPTLVDHAHDGWSGTARIDTAGRSISLVATGTQWLHLYMPPGEPLFCVEPVSHLPDAVNRPGQGTVTLQPGEQLTITMRIGGESDPAAAER